MLVEACSVPSGLMNGHGSQWMTRQVGSLFHRAWAYHGGGKGRSLLMQAAGLCDLGPIRCELPSKGIHRMLEAMCWPGILRRICCSRCVLRFRRHAPGVENEKPPTTSGRCLFQGDFCFRSIGSDTSAPWFSQPVQGPVRKKYGSVLRVVGTEEE